MTFKFKNIFLLDSIVIAGKLEGNGPLNKYFDYISDFKEDSFENSEIAMLTQSIDMLFEKMNLKVENIDIAIGGELSNQLTTTSYTLRKLPISLIGIYAACSTITLGIGVAGLVLANESVKNALVFTSSNNQSAERQFRNPVEYGGEKEETQTFTSTIAASTIISKEKSNISISAFTLGKVIDIGFTDPMDFGRAMAPAAIETLFEHFKNQNKTPQDYDLILTGDLSKYGYQIVKKALLDKYNYSKNYNDCGLMLYDIENQNVFAGGSGPGTSAAVLLSYIKKEMLAKKLKKVLICATGALMNPTMINQKNSIPCIAHAIELEVIE